MSGGYRTGQPPTDLAGLIAELDTIDARLDSLERPTGEASYQTVAKLSALVSNIQAQLDAYNAARYTNAQINSLVASPGNIAPGNVAASGNITAAGGVNASGDVNVGGALRAQSVYSTTLASAYRAVWSTSVDGQLGYVPSSERFKRDIATLVENADVLLKLNVVTFRYIAAVEELGKDADIEVGLIAERVDELGLWWLVDYEEDGVTPFGIRYERVGLAALLVAQYVAAQHADIALRVEALEARR